MSLRLLPVGLLPLVALLLACNVGFSAKEGSEVGDDGGTPTGDSGDDGGAGDGGDGSDGAGDSGDTGEPDPDPDPIDACSALGLEPRDFDPTGPAANHRREPAGDFSLPLTDGTTWTLSEQWSGCETYVFIPNWFPISSLDTRSWFDTRLDKLISGSPENVHYFFVVGTDYWGDMGEQEALMEASIDAELLDMDDEERDWWSTRLHVVHGAPGEFDGLVSDMLQSDVGVYGFGIDRGQKLRGLGHMASVTDYDSALSAAGEWPFETHLYPVGHEAEYFNYQYEREQRLAVDGATVVPIFGGEVYAEYVDGTVTLPEGSTMATFDTLEIDVLMECPDRDLAEPGNCGAWGYLAYLWIWDEATETWFEMGRFITSYHRETEWVVDATHALAWLQEGGTRTVRYSWAPSWNTQPTGITVDLRLSNQGKGMRPVAAWPLFQGGSFNSSYNTREPVAVDISAEAKKVELVAIITGHGMEANNCAEFCEHEHHFTVGGTESTLDFPVAGTSRGCENTVGTGTTPNQPGTWWYGRGGWCPGRQVDPYIVDVSAEAPAGSAASFTYSATMEGSEPPDGSGSIEMRSWAVVYE